MMKPLLTLLAASVSLLSLSSFASEKDYGITLYAGQTINQELTTSQARTYNFKDDIHFALSADIHEKTAKYGIYYSFYEGEIKETPIHEVEIEHLMFQSAVKMPSQFEGLQTYVGLALGLNRFTPNFTGSDTFFAAGLFSGLDYELGKGVSIQGEVRWTATRVDNSSDVVCDDDPTTVNMCSWHFDGDTLAQVQTSLAITYRF